MEIGENGEELARKQGKMETNMMAKKGDGRTTISSEQPSGELFGAARIPQRSVWWDVQRIVLFLDNAMMNSGVHCNQLDKLKLKQKECKCYSTNVAIKKLCSHETATYNYFHNIFS